MQTKFRLINICIRHKCTGVARSSNKTKSLKRIIISKKRTLPNDSTLTFMSDESRVNKSDKLSHNLNYLPEIVNHCTYKRLQGEEDTTQQNTKCLKQNTKSELCVKGDDFVKVTPMHINESNNILNNDQNGSSEKVNKSDVQDVFKHDDGKGDESHQTRVNEINLQMLSKSLYEQVFKNFEQRVLPSEEELCSIKETLRQFGINIEDATRVPDINMQIPALQGRDIEEHFYNIALTQAAPYFAIVNKIVEAIPAMPKEWSFREGWTRYTKDGTESIDHPLEDGLILDIEVAMKAGPLPTLATAVSNKAWYGWVSKSLAEQSAEVIENQLFHTNMLVPMESKPDDYGNRLNSFQKKPKIIVGHNVAYDRIRLKEQYWMNHTGTRFLDTMSLHICISGISSYQRAVLKKDKGNLENNEWYSNASLNNLADVYKLYCGRELDKHARNIFVEGTLADVKHDFQNLMTYCASDVAATYDVLHNTFPLFKERFPHPVSFAGMLELGCAYLPVNSNWPRYIEESESAYENLNYEAKITLAKRADAVCQLIHNEKYKEDLWMWDQDWSTQTIKTKALTKATRIAMEKELENKKKEESNDQKYLTDDENEEDPLEKQFSYLEATKHLLPAKMPHMPGYPAWYRKLCFKRSDENWQPGPQNISTSMQIAPKLLNLTWENYPLHYIREHGWGILVPYNDDPNVETNLPIKQLLAHCSVEKPTNCRRDADYSMSNLAKDLERDLVKTNLWLSKKKANENNNHDYDGTAIWCNLDIDDCCYFFKLPHKDGEKQRVGSPLARDFLNKFSENVLAGVDASATEVLKLTRMVSYWRNNRSRIMSQLVVWFEEQCLPSSMKRKKTRLRFGAILPQVVAAGTLTRRAVEPTWMTASNAHVERIGSELRSMIQAPPGYNIVGADVDSQELWISSMIGDAHFKNIHGATPFGWMTLIGSKSNGTDMHSVTAHAVGISRDHAKVINYARIYGAGQKFAERLLQQFNPSMTDAEAKMKSRKMFSITKGRKVFRPKPEYELEDREYSSYEAYKMSRKFGKPLEQIFGKGEWVGGSESAMFNRLEEIAKSERPVTPFLNSRLSRALEAERDGDEKHLPTKVNWVVQSGAVDFLHLMLVCMRWLMQDNARFCLSFHDEIRYLVPSRYKYNAALAMHITNLLTRCFCASRLGMRDLPMSVAFFAAVEVDTVLRKESSDDCKTPSNPHGLTSGYRIPHGESLDVRAALEKSGGSVGSWHKTKQSKQQTTES